MCNAIRLNATPHRISRILLRRGQKANPMNAAKYAKSGVLDAHEIIIKVDPMKPRAAKTLAFREYHSQKNSGTNVTPKVPAKIGCANGPCARMAPSRTSGTI